MLFIHWGNTISNMNRILCLLHFIAVLLSKLYEHIDKPWRVSSVCPWNLTVHVEFLRKSVPKEKGQERRESREVEICCFNAKSCQGPFCVYASTWLCALNLFPLLIKRQPRYQSCLTKLLVLYWCKGSWISASSSSSSPHYIYYCSAWTCPQPFLRN